MNTALPAAASGLVGEMYVPMDMRPAEEPDPFGDMKDHTCLQNKEL